QTTTTTSGICYYLQWNRTGVRVAGSSITIIGPSLKYFENPIDISIDKYYNIYVSDFYNNRVVLWKQNASIGQLIVGNSILGGDLSSQLMNPMGLYLDEINQQLYVCDTSNYRIQKYSLIQTSLPLNGTTIANVSADGSAPDIVYYASVYYDQQNNELYVLDAGHSRVLLYRNGTTENPLQIAGGNNGGGETLSDLNYPLGFYIDRNLTVYIADTGNHRIVKWIKNSQQGILVAGGNGAGSLKNQLDGPHGVYIDETDGGTIYIADTNNNRIQQWLVNATEGRTIAGDVNGTIGMRLDQLFGPRQVKFDKDFNLYVVDELNQRIVKFNLLHNGYDCH
ncbi:unnamed protein product, partial [Didymodactylos carnosus]